MKKMSFSIKVLGSCLALIALLVIPVFAQTTQTNYAQALQKALYFYDANKCGPDVTATSKLEWRGSCHVWDTQAAHPLDAGKTIDVRGGFHDCGDHVKFGQPQVYAIGTLGWSYYEFKEGFVKAGLQQHILDILKWSCDYLLRCGELDGNGKMRYFVYMVGKGTDDHQWWIPPELNIKAHDARPITCASPSTPASEICGGASAALSLMYLNYKDIDATYANKCLTYAKALYQMGRDYPGLGTGDGFYTPRDSEDEMSWAATWLYVCTNDTTYINHINSKNSSGEYTGYMKKIITSAGSTWQNIWVHSWDAAWGGAFTKLACLFPSDKDFDYYGRWNLEYWTGGMAKHADAKDTNYLTPTAGGYGMINTWGSARYNTAAQLCELVYYKYHKTDTTTAPMVEWCKKQMDYIFGNNKMGYSYEVGFPTPEKAAKHPHHRAAHGSKTLNMNVPPEHRHVLWGALVGGPDGADYHLDDTVDFVYNEVGVDYNAGFVGALAGLVEIAGPGAAILTNFPPKEPANDDFYAEAKLEQENKQRTQITIRIHNETIHPPRYVSGISCRYYFDISELIAKGQTISAITHDMYYDECKTINGTAVKVTGPTAYDAAKGIYYMSYEWTSDQWYGDLELQFGLVAAQDSSWKDNWDPTNDYSRQGVTSEFAVTSKIPVYLNGTLVYGAGPDGVTPQPSSSPTPTPTSTPTGTFIRGDVDGNGTVNIVDAMLVAQYSSGITPKTFNVQAADYNSDGVVNINDALRIAQHAAGLI